MASPHQSPAIVRPDLKGGHFLIVEAPFYGTISAMLREGATIAFREAGASADLVEVPGALEIPVAMAIALDHAEAMRGLSTERSRWVASFAATPIILRSSPTNARAR